MKEKREKEMSLRKQARILGISHTYLSMLVNGKRKWPEELKARYEELVTTSVTTPKANTSLTKASEDDFVPEIVVPRKGLEPSLSYREADFKFTAGCSPMSYTVRSGTHSLAVNRVPRQWRYSKDNYGL